jgi:hypothetical protein
LAETPAVPAAPIRDALHVGLVVEVADQDVACPQPAPRGRDDCDPARVHVAVGRNRLGELGEAVQLTGVTGGGTKRPSLQG